MSELAFCEPVWASVRSHEHIRVVEGERRLGGGIEGVALCGVDMSRGWDLLSTVTVDRIERGITAESNPTCRRCGSLAEAILTAPTHPDQEVTG
jgi:hypothetical protein